MEQQEALLFFEKVNEWIRGIEDQKFQPALQHYQQAVIVFNAAMEPATHNTLTIQISKEDECRNSAWQKIRKVTSELMSHPDTRYREVGKKIDAILRDCGDPTLVPTLQKTNALNHLNAKLEKNISTEEANRVNLVDLIIELNRANWCYTELTKVRKVELARKYITPSIANARKHVEKAYQYAIRFINAMSIYNGDSEYADIIDNINLLIEQMRKPALHTMKTQLECPA
jgi:hypothetical protein